MPLTDLYVATTITRGRVTHESKDGSAVLTTPCTLITWLPSETGGQYKRALQRHVSRVTALTSRYRSWRAGVDPKAPTVTRVSATRTIVTFPGESVEFHRLRALLPEGDVLITRASDPTKARVVTKDGFNYPVTLSESPELARKGHALREAVRRMTILETHFNDETWASEELIGLYKTVDTLRGDVMVMSEFGADGDDTRRRKERQAAAARQRRAYERQKYNRTLTRTTQNHAVTSTWSWILCYCPHVKGL